MSDSASRSNRGLSLNLYKVHGYLTTLQNVSAATFVGFVVIHGAQIAVSLVGGIDQANNWLLLGRPFYQDKHVENIILNAATVHVIAGAAKAGIRTYWNRHRASSTTSTSTTTTTSQARHLFKYHREAGYALVPLVFVHAYLARKLPQIHFGDSAFVDFGLIAWGLQNRPLFTYTTHVALARSAGQHLNQAKEAHIVEQQRQKRMMHIKTAVATSVGAVLLGGLIVIGQAKKIPLRREYARIYQMMLWC
ncbi:uncharacterized protein BYT42DRAFT_194339 [Radiomyces spectabilis]|uniref:uncharacterized protein n=1 Tax=Radiomyces spectabilis TaxID=64574 RepID=UPI0022209B0A|nr:uncharacterized protein BYT42DRAFT_194339 [Radiomyces spectabilis]KAI8391436.1 hypothetical protein BYT42DRAFT_194339 [Radiomyces spectabilis]